MNNDDLIERLKNPQKYRQTQPSVQQEQLAPVVPTETGHPTASSRLKSAEVIVGGAVVVVFLLTLLSWMVSKNRAENLVAALDPGQLQGLAQEEAVFNPNKGITYVEVREGHDRNMALDNLGSTLPIISRFNFQTFTSKNYTIVGAAPWALTTNFEANLADPEIMRYLLDNDTMIEAFLEREDVAPLLEDPQLLAAFCEDPRILQEFFTQDTVKAVLDSPQMVRTVMGSRFMSHLLISKSGKYFRAHPQEAVAIINQNPYLSALRDNKGVVTAVNENPYLKKIAAQLLAKPVEAPAQTTNKTADKTTSARNSKNTKSGSKTKSASRAKK